MKRVIIVIFVFLLAACSNGNVEPTPEVEATEEQPASLEPTDQPSPTAEEVEPTQEPTDLPPTEPPPTATPEPTAPPEPTATELPPTEPPVSEEGWPFMVSNLPEGDPASGEELYNVTYGCMSCHGDIIMEGSNAVGPWHGNLAEVAATRIEGYTAADYAYESILLPSAFIVPDCPTGPCAGPPSIMPANFGDQMTPQEMADILAFMLGTTTFEGDVEIVYPAP